MRVLQALRLMRVEETMQQVIADFNYEKDHSQERAIQSPYYLGRCKQLKQIGKL